MFLAILFALHLYVTLSHTPPLYDFTKLFAQKQVRDGPSQVHVNYPGLDQMVVNWVSSSANDPSQVMYGVDKSNLSLSAQGTATSYSFEGYTSGGLHSVLLQGLAPSTTYYYQVGGPGQWSSIYNFKSAPPVGKEDIIIGAMADVGADPNSELTINGLMDWRKEDRLDLVIHAGDLSYANNYNPGGPVWDHFGDILEPLLAYTPYSPGVGNHESIDNFLAFRLRFSTDMLIKNSGGGDFYWSFDFGIIHFIHLSSENDFNVSSPQYNWLQNDLKKVNRTLTPWIIGIWHRPWYTSSETHGEDDAMRVAMEPLFITYNVDLAIVGHVHSYERITEIADHVITKGATAYITIGNGGTPEGLAKNWKTQPDWSEFRLAEWGYARLRVHNATHAHWEMRTDSDESTTDDHWFVKTRN